MHINKHILFTFFVPLGLLLSACGGGSGGEGSSSSLKSVPTAKPTSTQNQAFPRAAVVAQTDASAFVDASGVSGLTYSCGIEARKTLTNGVFNCSQFPIDFFLGNLNLGTVNSISLNNKIFTTDLLLQARDASRHPVVSNVSMLLQSLDEDSNLQNGITITQTIINATNQYFYADTNISTMSTAEMNLAISDIIQTLADSTPSVFLTQVNTQDAQDNLTASIALAK